MRRALGALCILVVGLQILVAVPLAVCFVFFLVVGSGGMGPIAVEVHTGQHAAVLSTTVPPPSLTSATIMVPPPNVIPHALPTPHDNPILQSRAEHGSPLAGTVLGETIPAEAEQQLFVAAFEKVAAQQADPKAEADAATAQKTACGDQLQEKATQFAIQQLYLMADMDEQAGEFDRADQWRGLARELRSISASGSFEFPDSPR